MPDPRPPPPRPRTVQPGPPTRPGTCTGLVALALLLVTAIPALSQSRTLPVDPSTVNQHLEIGPVPGFTTIWHPAPTETSVPRGETLRFRVSLPVDATVEWEGATEVARGFRSIAEVTVDQAGPHRVAVRVAGDGAVVEEGIDLMVQPVPGGGFSIMPIELTVDPLDLDDTPSNSATLEYFFRDSSIAALTKVEPGHYRTSINRWMTASARAVPPGFAPLVEWRVDDVVQEFLGSEVRLMVFPARTFEIAAGTGAGSRTVRLDTYMVRITSHERYTDLPEGVPLTFTAETEPPGHEDEITWLASTKYGTALPLTTQGAELRTVFVNTLGAEGRWLGVRADHAKVSEDQKFAGSPFGMDDVDVPQVSVRATAVCGDAVTHRLEVLWSFLNLEEPKYVEIDVILGDGTTFQASGGDTGAAQFEVDVPFGGGVFVRMRAAPADDPTALVPVAETTGLLTGCLDLVAPPPGSGFEPGGFVDTNPGSGQVREVDLAVLGDSGEIPGTILVTSAGSGSALRLDTWSSQEGAPPLPLQSGELQIGFDVRLHALDVDPAPTEFPIGPPIVPFLLASRRPDGNLWLSLYTAGLDGALERHATVGYGANADVTVAGFAIDHRAIFDSPDEVTYQVVTPVLTDTGETRVVVWEVDWPSLTLRGVQDNGSHGTAALDTLLQTSHIGRSLFAVAWRNADDILESRLWSIGMEGVADEAGRGASGIPLRGGGTVRETVSEVALAPLEERGYVTATPSAPGDRAEMVVWQPRITVAPDVALWDPPYRISDDREDLNPGSGVLLPGLSLPNDAIDFIDKSPRSVYAQVTDDLWERFGRGRGGLFQQMPDQEPSGIASVTKVMTLTLALEAVAEPGRDLSLDDVFEIQPEAGACDPNNFSCMGLSAGERWSLRNLLYGMMLPSGNDAATAVAQAVANDNVKDFVDAMNDKAADLGMGSTDYGNPWGQANSLPQDQITLMSYGLRAVPLFDELVTRKQALAKGFGPFPFNVPIEIPLSKWDSGYPGLAGWKNGSVGRRLDSKPLCTKGGCLSAAATRLGRTMLVALQASGNITRDSNRLFDYAFRRIFTPDLRGDDGGVAGSASEIAVDRIFDNRAVTAVVDPAGDLEVCTWRAEAGAGTLDRLGCGLQPAPPLPPGSAVRNPTVELVRLSTEDAHGDYLRGILRGGQLELDLWRVGPKAPPGE